jgi:hypothetical protein
MLTRNAMPGGRRVCAMQTHALQLRRPLCAVFNYTAEENRCRGLVAHQRFCPEWLLPLAKIDTPLFRTSGNTHFTSAMTSSHWRR